MLALLVAGLLALVAVLIAVVAVWVLLLDAPPAALASGRPLGPALCGVAAPGASFGAAAPPAGHSAAGGGGGGGGGVGKHGHDQGEAGKARLPAGGRAAPAGAARSGRGGGRREADAADAAPVGLAAATDEEILRRLAQVRSISNDLERLISRITGTKFSAGVGKAAPAAETRGEGMSTKLQAGRWSESLLAGLSSFRQASTPPAQHHDGGGGMAAGSLASSAALMSPSAAASELQAAAEQTKARIERLLARIGPLAGKLPPGDEADGGGAAEKSDAAGGGGAGGDATAEVAAPGLLPPPPPPPSTRGAGAPQPASPLMTSPLPASFQQPHDDDGDDHHGRRKKKGKRKAKLSATITATPVPAPLAVETPAPPGGPASAAVVDRAAAAADDQTAVAAPCLKTTPPSVPPPHYAAAAGGSGAGLPAGKGAAPAQPPSLSSPLPPGQATLTTTQPAFAEAATLPAVLEKDSAMLEEFGRMTLDELGMDTSYVFHPNSSSVQRKIKQHYDELVKANADKTLSLAQIGRFTACLVEAKAALQQKSETIHRKFTITRSLLAKADKASNDRLCAQIHGLKLEQKKLEEDICLYNHMQEQLKQSPAYKKMLEYGKNFEVASACSAVRFADRPEEEEEEEEISFEELLAQEKKDAFWETLRKKGNAQSAGGLH